MTEVTEGRKDLHWLTVSEGSVCHGKASWMMGVAPSTGAGVYCRAYHTEPDQKADYTGSKSGL